jgi:hypothetical protein
MAGKRRSKSRSNFSTQFVLLQEERTKKQKLKQETKERGKSKKALKEHPHAQQARD